MILAAAVPAGVANTVVYPAGFYTQFAPNSAADMVRQTPGFTIQEGADRRGFSGSGGNVLIDGERPSAKSATLESLLAQIPAAQVDRIELIRGGEQAGTGATQSVLLNVVRRRASGKGAWGANIRYSEKGDHASPQASATWSGPTAAGELTLSASRTYDFGPTSGPRTSALIGGPEIVSLDISPRTTGVETLNAELKRTLFGGAARFNGRIQHTDYNNRQVTLPPVGSGRNRAETDLADDTDVFEAGGYWERQFGDYTLRLVALGTQRHFTDDIDARTINPADVQVFQQIQARTTDTTELIGRAVLSHPLPEGHQLEIGLETALNTFDAALALQADTGGGLHPVPLPASNVHLEELRSEGFVADSWPLGGWQINGVLAVEVSTLTQTGDTNLTTDLIYVKPSLEAVRPISKTDQIRVKLYRDVGQLNFEDFVSFAAIFDDRVVGGNPNLRPQTQWRLEAGYDKRFWAKGALNVLVYYAWASDVADVVPLLNKYDAPGNIGSGEFWGGLAKLTLPLNPWIKGGLLTAQLQVDESRVTDPTTGLTRRASNLSPTVLGVQFRQDLPAWKAAWGFSTIKYAGYTAFRRLETDNYEQEFQLDAFAERSLTPQLKVRLYGTNLTPYSSVRTRVFYAPDRTGDPVSYEIRDRSRGRFVGLELKGTF